MKWHTSVNRFKQLQPILLEAFKRAQQGVPGPVFVEIPVDLLYDEAVVRNWYGNKSPGNSIAGKLQKLYLNYHVNRLFAGAETLAVMEQSLKIPTPANPPEGRLKKVATRLKEAKKPLLLLGSQVVFHPGRVKEIAGAVRKLNIPVYLSGMSRGLLGKSHPLQMRHKRREALRQSDFIILAGVPCDFRLDYGRHIPRGASVVSVNLSRAELFKNRRPNLAIQGYPGAFLVQLGELFNHAGHWEEWRLHLRQRDKKREQEISEQAQSLSNGINPLYLCSEIEKFIRDDAIIVADGGDFVATASYILRPPGPLTWLDPGAFGTLGVGAGFALGAKLKNPSSEVWILYGDGAAGFSMTEFDTFVRHKIPVIAVVGNDGAWSQIAREQVDILEDDTGTVLRQTDYHRVAEGFGAKGFLLEEPGQIPRILQQARQAAGEGWPVLINALIGKTDFRKGAISM